MKRGSRNVRRSPSWTLVSFIFYDTFTHVMLKSANVSCKINETRVQERQADTFLDPRFIYFTSYIIKHMNFHQN